MAALMGLALVIPALQGQEWTDGGEIQGVWAADRYELAGGAEHALRGQIMFDQDRWTVLFFVLGPNGEPVRASAEGGTYHATADTVTFSHLYNYSEGEAVEGMAAAEMRMVARESDGPLEPTRYSVNGDELSLFFPSGNRMRFTHTSTPAVANDQRVDVLATVHELLAALSAGDREAMRRLTVDEAVFWAVDQGSGSVPRRTVIDEFIEGMSPGWGMLERIWNPSVRIDGDVAQVWAPYDFYRSGAFSHCGTDAFHLARSEGVWRVTTITYSVQTTGCAESPLGTPGDVR